MRGGAGEDNTGSRGSPPTTYTHTQCTHTHNAHTRRTQHTHMHTTYIHNVHTCTQHTHNIHTRTHAQVCTQRTCMHNVHTRNVHAHTMYTHAHTYTPRFWRHNSRLWQIGQPLHPAGWHHQAGPQARAGWPGRCARGARSRGCPSTEPRPPTPPVGHSGSPHRVPPRCSPGFMASSADSHPASWARSPSTQGAQAAALEGGWVPEHQPQQELRARRKGPHSSPATSEMFTHCLDASPRKGQRDGCKCELGTPGPGALPVSPPPRPEPSIQFQGTREKPGWPPLSCPSAATPTLFFIYTHTYVRPRGFFSLFFFFPF